MAWNKKKIWRASNLGIDKKREIEMGIIQKLKCKGGFHLWDEARYEREIELGNEPWPMHKYCKLCKHAKRVQASE